MTGNRNHLLTKLEQLGEENVRSAIALGKYVGKQLTAAQQWLDKSEHKRERKFTVENKKANMVLIIAAAIGMLILSIAIIV
jgi:hypothetical protein